MNKSTNIINSTLTLHGQVPVKAMGGGILLSRNDMPHPNRVINHFDLIFVRQGVLSMKENGQFFQIHAGETLLLWPWRHHSGTEPYPPDLEFFWLHFNLANGEHAERFHNAPLALRQHQTVQRPDVLSELMRRYMNAFETSGLSPLQCDLLVWLILCEVAREEPLDAAKPADMLAGRAYRLIRSHFHEALTASSVAAHLECSPQHLSRVFHKVYGQTVTHCINRTRIERACVLLIHSSLNAGEIARVCGFENVGYFYRMFRRQEGITAMAYRHMHALSHISVN
jgi:AraC-like DNA-binding protein